MAPKKIQMESVMTESRPLVSWGWSVGDLAVKNPKEIFTFGVIENVPILIVVAVTQVCKFVKTHRKVHFYIHITVHKLYLESLFFNCTLSKMGKKAKDGQS